MKIKKLGFLAVSICVSMSWAHAANSSFTISGNSSATQSLGNGQTGTVTSTGVLTYASGTGIAINGSSTSASNKITLTNSGIIKEGTGRDIRDQSGGSNSLITNNAGALIQGVGNDVIALNVNGSATTSASVMDIENYGTIQSLDAGGSGTTTPTAQGNQAINMKVTTGSNTVNNYSTGVIWATAADAVRPGLNGVVHNDGFIYSNTYQGSGSDGIDAQTNTGVTIVNGATTSSPNVAQYHGTLTGYVGASTSVTMTQSTIEGGRHGITGGNTGTNTSSPTYQDTNNPTQPGLYTMSVTNNQGATIQGDNGSGINIDGFGYIDPTTHKSVTNELVTINNHGMISGNGVTGDGDGVDVDGAVAIDNFGTIVSNNAVPESGSPIGTIEFSEGVTVGGGSITNEQGATIEGKVASGNTQAVGRGITLAGVDKGADDSAIPIQSVYQYAGASPSITNSGLIKGDSESGIAVLGTTGGGSTVTITNNATGTIEGNNSGVSENTQISPGVFSGQSLNKAAIELDDTGNTYVINNSGTIKQDNTTNGTAVAMHGASNQLNVTGGSASIIGNVSGDTAADSTMTVNPGNGNTFSYGYSISNFSLQVNADGGNGTVILSGTNSYSGATTVNAGKLDVKGSTTNSTTTVKNTGTLQGTGTAGGVVVNNGGKISPGDSSTTVASTQAGSTNSKFQVSSLTLDGGSTMSFTLYDTTASTGTFANPAGGTQIDIAGAFLAGVNVTAGSIFIDLNGTASSGDVNRPNIYTLAEFATGESTVAINDFTVEDLGNLGTSAFTLAYVDENNGKTDLDLEVVPEPGTWALLLAGLAFLPLARTRFRWQA